MKQKVVIIGHGYTSRLGIIRSLAAMDCEITVIAMVLHGWWGRLIRFEGGKPIDCCSKHVSRVLYSNVTDENGLIDLLLAKCVDSQQKVILIPDSDFSAVAIDRHQDRLRSYFLFPNINYSAGAVEHWMDKNVQKKLAREIGMNIAEGRIVSVENNHYEFPENVNYPCFTKALATISGGKQFLKRCNNEVELRCVLDKVSLKYNTRVLIEDFKTIDTEYAVVGVSDGKNVIIPGVIKFLVNSKSHFGIAREGIIMPPTGFEEIFEHFKSFVCNIGFCGLFDVDFYESGGKMYFGEINLRFGGSGYAYTAMGVNLPVMLVHLLRGENIDRMKQEITDTATYVNERMCLDDYVHGHISEEMYQKIIKSADIRFVYDVSDPGPQKKLDSYFMFARLNRLRRKFK